MKRIKHGRFNTQEKVRQEQQQMRRDCVKNIARLCRRLTDQELNSLMRHLASIAAPSFR